VERISTTNRLASRVAAALAKSGFVVKSHRRLPNNYGDQLVFTSGQIADVYDSGMLVCNGPDRGPLIEACKRLWPQASTSSFRVSQSK